MFSFISSALSLCYSIRSVLSIPNSSNTIGFFISDRVFRTDGLGAIDTYHRDNSGLCPTRDVYRNHVNIPSLQKQHFTEIKKTAALRG